MSGVVEVHKDDSYILKCQHTFGSGGLILKNRDVDFLAFGIYVGQAVHNETDGSTGVVTAVTHETVTCTLAGGTANTFTRDDVVYFYATTSIDTYISSMTTDRSRGWKVTKRAQLDDDGWLPEDADLDRDNKEVFGPGQPEEVR